jgi:hypothetical protein
MVFVRMNCLTIRFSLADAQPYVVSSIQSPGNSLWRATSLFCLIDRQSGPCVCLTSSPPSTQARRHAQTLSLTRPRTAHVAARLLPSLDAAYYRPPLPFSSRRSFGPSHSRISPFPLPTPALPTTFLLSPSLPVPWTSAQPRGSLLLISLPAPWTSPRPPSRPTPSVLHGPASAASLLVSSSFSLVPPISIADIPL